MTARPSVTVHYAQTLDGRIATRTGDSQWIGGEESLHLAHQLRSSHETILVGVGTVLADDPRLTVRHVPGPSPIRVVVDSGLQLPLGANVLADGASATLVATTARAPADRVQAVRRSGAEVILVSADEVGRVDLRELFAALAGRGLTSLLIEGGAGVITSALRLRLVDRLVLTIAPKLVGLGIEAIGDLGIQRLREAIEFREGAFAPCGRDIVFDGRL